MDEVLRTPCPERILEDTGGAFLIGSIGSSILYTIKGMRNLPMGRKISGIASMIRLRSPSVAGNFASWGLAFSSFECMLIGLRKKEDPFNSILAGGLAGGILTMHKGSKAIKTSAFFGFAILSIIEVVSYQLNKTMKANMEEMQRMSLESQGIIVPPKNPQGDSGPMGSSGNIAELNAFDSFGSGTIPGSTSNNSFFTDNLDDPRRVSSKSPNIRRFSLFNQ